MYRVKGILIVSLMLLSIAIALYFCSRIVQKYPVVSMILSKDNDHGIMISYNMLHNVYIMGGSFRIIDYVIARSPDCDVRLKNNSLINSLDFRLTNFTKHNNPKNVEYSATITVEGDFLENTPKRRAIQMISDRLSEAYLGVMNCYKHKDDMETLLD